MSYDFEGLLRNIPHEDYEIPILTCTKCGNNSTNITVKFITNEIIKEFPNLQHNKYKYICTSCLSSQK